MRGVFGVQVHAPVTGGPSPTPALDGWRARGAALQSLVEGLWRASTPTAIAELTVTIAAELLGADRGAVYVHRDGPGTLDVLHAGGWPDETLRDFRQVIVRRGRPLSDAVLDGSPVWIEDAGQWRARYPEMAPVGTSSGNQATACLPLRMEHRAIGAVVFSFSQPRRFQAEERDYLQAVAALCAQALDRVRIYAAERAALAAADHQRERLAFLARAGHLMEAPLSVEKRVQRLADLAVPDLADWCAVHLVRDGRVERVAVAHSDPGKVRFVADLGRRYPPDPRSDGSAIHVARTGTPSFVPDLTDELLVANAVDRTHLELVRSIGMRSYMVVPLLVRGRSLGALTVVQAESGRRFVEADLEFFSQLATTAAVALDNARLYEHQAHIATTLQAALLPGELPSVPGLRIAARHRSPDSERGEFSVGGDLYDAVLGAQAAGSPSAVMVGDVCGKGPEAAALIALIRHTWRAELRHGVGPADVLRGVNAAMLARTGPDPYRFATVAHAGLRTDPGGATATLVSGGHPPPLVLRGGRVETCDVSGTLLGIYPDPTLAELEVRLHPGDSLVLYTDGVTEARGADGFYGEGRLAAVLGSCAGASPDEVADTLMADVCAFQADRLCDDVAILVVQAAP